MSPMRVAVLIPALASFVFAATRSPDRAFDLTSKTWAITVDPSSMQVTSRRPGQSPIVLSAGQNGLGTVTGLDVSADSARWELPERNVSIRMALNGDELGVEIRSSKTGVFTWPVLRLTDPVKALIWPFAGGRYVPLDNEAWTSFLKSDEWNTLDELTMPFWGLYCGSRSVTYIATNRYNNGISFEETGEALQAAFAHTFPASKKTWAYGILIRLSDTPSPVEPARQFRQWLIDTGAFVPMSEKLTKTPEAKRLLGAAHVYLWGDALLTRHDIRRGQWTPFCRTLIAQAKTDTPSVGKRIHTLMKPERWKQVVKITALARPYHQIKSAVTNELSRLLALPGFYDEASWQGVTLPDDATHLLGRDRDTLSTPELARLNGLLLQAAYPDVLLPIDKWGDGVSVKMLEQLKEAGLDRMRLCVTGWEGVELRPEVARVADEMGYLFGTYDSFHSIHDPELAGTDASWTTAQFGRELYETGGIEKEDGTKRAGFNQRGYLLSPHAARPAVEARVRRNMRNVPYNYYFIDCDAYGEVCDDYSPLHPSTQQQDAAARVDRMTWICDTFDVVIGSEGGSAYAAPAIHVSEGLLTSGIGWGDPDMSNRESEYYIGAYFPPDGPRRFFDPTPLKPWYRERHYDARFRLPLNEIVYHDAFVSTHHWGSSSLKFSNVLADAALTEMLYQCPPLYHLNLDALKKRRATIKKHYDFFSPVHRQVGFAAMTDFAWVSNDRLVQRTVFDDHVEIIANFGPSRWKRGDLEVPARSVTARWRDNGRTLSFTAPSDR